MNDNKDTIQNLPMFDHLFIFGGAYQLHPIIKNINISPSLLCAFPSTENKMTVEELKQLSTFCFPDGFKELNLQQNRFDWETIHIIDTFAFFFKELNQKSYVSVVKFSLSDENSIFFANKMNKKYPFCMCMLSKNPCISKHIKFMTKLIYVLFGNSPSHQNLPAIPKHSNVHGLCYQPLVFDKKFMSVAVCKGMHVPEIFISELIYYQNKKFTYDNRMQPNQYLLYPTIHTVLSFLSPEKLVQVYTAVLLEKKVLFVSNSASKYSSAVIALNSLSTPFDNSTLILPIVPKEFSILLDSPVPYIAGSSFYNSNADVTIDLDNDIFITKEEDPCLPSQNELIKKLKTLIEYEKETVMIPKKKIKTFFKCEKINPKYIEFVENMNEIIYPICHIRDLNIVLNQETTDVIKLLFDWHILPKLANFVNTIKNSDFFGEKNEQAQNAKSSNPNFYHEFFLTQCGSSLIDKYKDNTIDLLKLLL